MITNTDGKHPDSLAALRGAAPWARGGTASRRGAAESKHGYVPVAKADAIVEWRAIAGMRDRLIHGYFGIDNDIVWDATTEKIRELVETVERIIRRAGRR